MKVGVFITIDQGELACVRIFKDVADAHNEANRVCDEEGGSEEVSIEGTWTIYECGDETIHVSEMEVKEGRQEGE